MEYLLHCLCGVDLLVVA